MFNTLTNQDPTPRNLLAITVERMDTYRETVMQKNPRIQTDLHRGLLQKDHLLRDT